MLNEAVAIGRTTADIEERQTSTGKSVCSFTLAVGRDYNREEVDWIDCVAWGELAGTMSRLVKKGTLIAVKGSLQTRNFDDKKLGIKRKVTEIVVQNFYFCEKKADSAITAYKDKNESGYSNTGAEDFRDIPVSEDDLPF